MEKHLELTDAEFEQQFRNCALSSSIFSHEAHLRLAWIHIYRYGPEQAAKNIPTQLQNFVASVGAKDKYNATLTIAAIKAVDHFINRSSTHNFKDFITENPRLKYNFKELMAAHYGFDIYSSEKAKAQYITPDLLPFT